MRFPICGSASVLDLSPINLAEASPTSCVHERRHQPTGGKYLRNASPNPPANIPLPPPAITPPLSAHQAPISEYISETPPENPPANIPSLPVPRSTSCSAGFHTDA